MYDVFNGYWQFLDQQEHEKLFNSMDIGYGRFKGPGYYYICYGGFRGSHDDYRTVHILTPEDVNRELEGKVLVARRILWEANRAAKGEQPC